MDRDTEELAEVEAELVGLSSLFDFLCYVNSYFVVDNTLVCVLNRTKIGRLKMELQKIAIR